MIYFFQETWRFFYIVFCQIKAIEYIVKYLLRLASSNLVWQQSRCSMVLRYSQSIVFRFLIRREHTTSKRRMLSLVIWVCSVLANVIARLISRESLLDLCKNVLRFCQESFRPSLAFVVANIVCSRLLDIIFHRKECLKTFSNIHFGIHSMYLYLNWIFQKFRIITFFFKFLFTLNNDSMKIII